MWHPYISVSTDWEVCISCAIQNGLIDGNASTSDTLHGDASRIRLGQQYQHHINMTIRGNLHIWSQHVCGLSCVILKPQVLYLVGTHAAPWCFMIWWIWWPKQVQLSSTVPNHNGSRYMRLPYIDSRALVENVNSSYILQFDRKSENFYYLYLWNCLVNLQTERR